MERPFPSIVAAKDAFNRFFKEDLYGQFSAEDNIILSRGSWKDTVVRLPEFFRYCLNYTLDKHWIGYSSSLGHERTFSALLDLVNVGQRQPYTQKNCALTIGNVATMGFVFDQLKESRPDSKVLTLEPYYPSIMKAVGQRFPVGAVSSLLSEGEILDELQRQCRADKAYQILLLSNFIGVEGRIFSREFWTNILRLNEEMDLHTVIDEGLWFDRLEYPEDMNSDRITRLVSTSKKYGNPGMKIGFMLASEAFMDDYYDRASTNLGGPPSVMFFLSEFLYKFEYILRSGDMGGLSQLARRYMIDEDTIRSLFQDFSETIDENQRLYSANRGELVRWTASNTDVIRRAHLFDGVSFLVEPATRTKCYQLFLSLIQQKKVSVFPSACLGDASDSMCRITVLESQEEVREGLSRIADFLRHKSAPQSVSSDL
jgi:aspartate/methionine/tyrosine aminotransferase